MELTILGEQSKARHYIEDHVMREKGQESEGMRSVCVGVSCKSGGGTKAGKSDAEGSEAEMLERGLVAITVVTGTGENKYCILKEGVEEEH